MLKYKRIFLLSEEDFRIAEGYKKRGWRIVEVGIDYILFEK